MKEKRWERENMAKKNEKIKIEPGSDEIVNKPSISEMAPIVDPFTCTVAPAIGKSVSSTIFPDIALDELLLLLV